MPANLHVLAARCLPDTSVTRAQDLPKANVLIFANKQDVSGAMSAAEISTELKLTSLKGHSWQIQACCALTGEGLYAGMEWISQQVAKKGR